MMNITIVTLVLIIFIMIVVQICFRENYSIIDQNKFRRNRMNFFFNKLKLIETDGKDTECKMFNSERSIDGKYLPLSYKKHCEGFDGSMKNSEIMDLHNFHCSPANKLLDKDEVWSDEDWRNRIEHIPKETIQIQDRMGGKKKYGCGFCYDNRKILVGDDNGPYISLGDNVCENWIKPGGMTALYPGGTTTTKNIFTKKTPVEGFNSGVQKDSVKLSEQELCSKMTGCGDQKYLNENGEPLCGWCSMGRDGKGEGEGMVRKGGGGEDQNEAKYSDDYCVWPRELDEEGKKTNWYKKKALNLPKSHELRRWKESSMLLQIDTEFRGRLINGIEECKALDELLPCFANFGGNLKDNHSDECYNEMWVNYGKYREKPICTGNIKDRVKSNLPNTRTFVIWDKTYIPSVEKAIEEIPKRALTSKQYNKLNPNSTDPEDVQMMFSANLNHKTCYNRDADPCDDSYRSKEYGYPRPKKCIDDILMSLKLDKTKPEYQPHDINTYKYYWAVDNDAVWKEGVHYSWSNAEFKKKLKDMLDFNKKQISTLKRNGAGENGELFDKILKNHYYLYGKMKEDIKYWKDSEGNMDATHPWVKVCWSDFKKIMKQTYKNDVAYTKDGWLEINEMIKNKICIKMGNKNQCCQEGKSLSLCKGSILTNTMDNDSIPLILKVMSGGNGTKKTYITKEIYEQLLFPFWRLLSSDFYIKHKWRVYIAKRKNDNVAYKLSVSKKSKSYYLTEDRGYSNLGNDKNAVLKMGTAKASSRITYSYVKTVNNKDYYYFKLNNKFLNGSSNVVWKSSNTGKLLRMDENGGRYKIITMDEKVICFNGDENRNKYFNLKYISSPKDSEICYFNFNKI